MVLSRFGSMSMIKFRYNCYSMQGRFSFIHNLVFYSSSSSSTKAQPLSFASYLVDSLGFSEQQSLKTSTRLTLTREAQGTTNASDFTFVKNADNVIHYFKQIGFDQSHIRKLVCSLPKILLSDVDVTIKPKIEFFLKLGCSANDLVLIFPKQPALLLRGVDTGLMPTIEILRKVVDDDNDVIKVFKKCHFNISYKKINECLIDNFNILVEYGIPVDMIRKRFLLIPGLLLRPKKQLQDLLNRAEQELGIPRDSPMLFYGVHVLSSNSKRTLEAKYEVFRNFGWTQSDIEVMIRSNPYTLVISEARLKKSLDFLMNELGCKPPFLATHCNLLLCSLEKRIVPRYRIMLVLKEKGLIKKQYALSTLTSMSELKFVKRFVLPFKEVHDIYSEYMGHPVQLLTQDKEDAES